MFVKLTEKQKKEDKDWKVSIIECQEAHYVPIEQSDADKQPDDDKVIGYIHLEPGPRRITIWKDNICHIYLLNSNGQTIDKIN